MEVGSGPNDDEGARRESRERSSSNKFELLSQERRVTSYSSEREDGEITFQPERGRLEMEKA